MSKPNKTNTAAAVAAPVAEESVADRIAKVDLSACTTISARMRTLVASGFSDGQIAKALGKRPQHVRNVRITPVTNPRTATI